MAKKLLDTIKFLLRLISCVSICQLVVIVFMQVINDIDFEFVHKLAAECPAKIIAEGHIHYPEQAVKALEAGAFALVVGGAITRPAEITARFTGAINAMHK